MSTISSFKSIENKFIICRGKDSMKRFLGSLREHKMGVIKFKKKKNRRKCKNNIKMQTNCYNCTDRFKDKHAKDKNYLKVRDRCHYAAEYRGVAYSICNLEYSIPNENRTAFHNGSNYDYHFIRKELEEWFVKQLSCLGENTK